LTASWPRGTRAGSECPERRCSPRALKVGLVREDRGPVPGGLCYGTDRVRIKARTASEERRMRSFHCGCETRTSGQIPPESCPCPSCATPPSAVSDSTRPTRRNPSPRQRRREPFPAQKPGAMPIRSRSGRPTLAGDNGGPPRQRIREDEVSVGLRCRDRATRGETRVPPSRTAARKQKQCTILAGQPRRSNHGLQSSQFDFTSTEARPRRFSALPGPAAPNG
jgi:hypothetical protein